MSPKPTLTVQSRAGPADHGRGQAQRLPVPIAAVLAAVRILAAACLCLPAAVAVFIFTNPPYLARVREVCHVRGVKDRGRSQRQ